jgi:hypothetical protein
MMHVRPWPGSRGHKGALRGVGWGPEFRVVTRARRPRRSLLTVGRRFMITKSQTRRGSFIDAVFNILVGIGVAYVFKGFQRQGRSYRRTILGVDRTTTTTNDTIYKKCSRNIERGTMKKKRIRIMPPKGYNRDFSRKLRAAAEKMGFTPKQMHERKAESPRQVMLINLRNIFDVYTAN